MKSLLDLKMSGKLAKMSVTHVTLLTIMTLHDLQLNAPNFSCIHVLARNCLYFTDLTLNNHCASKKRAILGPSIVSGIL